MLSVGAAPPRGRAQRVLVLVVAAGVLLTVGGLVGASFVRSPSEVAAAQKPPAPDVLTAEVTRQRVASTVVTRGTVAADREITFTPESAVGAARLVVSARPPKVGTRVRGGDLVAVVSGRPVLALAGSVPAYRDLKVGDTGPDVAQLRAALAAVGFGSSADRPGTFGPATAAAVTRFYASRGASVAKVAGGGAEAAVPAAAPPVEVPMGEVFFVPDLPAVLTRVEGRLGAPVVAPFLTVQTGGLAVTARVEPTDRGAIDVGQAVEVADAASGLTRAGRITSIGKAVTPAAGDESAGGDPFLPVRVVTARPLPADEIGADVQVTIVRARTRGAVTAVPVAAVMTAADGADYVVVVAGDGRQTRVPVRTGVVGPGVVQVTGRVVAGQRVLVGA